MEVDSSEEENAVFCPTESKKSKTMKHKRKKALTDPSETDLKFNQSFEENLTESVTFATEHAKKKRKTQKTVPSPSNNELVNLNFVDCKTKTYENKRNSLFILGDNENNTKKKKYKLNTKPKKENTVIQKISFGNSTTKTTADESHNNKKIDESQDDEMHFDCFKKKNKPETSKKSCNSNPKTTLSDENVHENLPLNTSSSKTKTPKKSSFNNKESDESQEAEMNFECFKNKNKPETSRHSSYDKTVSEHLSLSTMKIKNRNNKKGSNQCDKTENELVCTKSVTKSFDGETKSCFEYQKHMSKIPKSKQKSLLTKKIKTTNSLKQDECFENSTVQEYIKNFLDESFEKLKKEISYKLISNLKSFGLEGEEIKYDRSLADSMNSREDYDNQLNKKQSNHQHIINSQIKLKHKKKLKLEEHSANEVNNMKNKCLSEGKRLDWLQTSVEPVHEDEVRSSSHSKKLKKKQEISNKDEDYKNVKKDTVTPTNDLEIEDLRSKLLLQAVEKISKKSSKSFIETNLVESATSPLLPTKKKKRGDNYKPVADKWNSKSETNNIFLSKKAPAGKLKETPENSSNSKILEEELLSETSKNVGNLKKLTLQLKK